MNYQTTGLLVASVVFGLMAIAQLVRLLIRPEVLVAGYSMPLWPSVLALIFLGGLSLWMWKLARTPTKWTNFEPRLTPSSSSARRRPLNANG
jgi:hypothetical protein